MVGHGFTEKTLKITTLARIADRNSQKNQNRVTLTFRRTRRRLGWRLFQRKAGRRIGGITYSWPIMAHGIKPSRPAIKSCGTSWTPKGSISARKILPPAGLRRTERLAVRRIL